MKFYLVMVVCVISINIETCLSSNQLGNTHMRDRREASTVPKTSLFYYQEPNYPRDCKEVYEQCDSSEESGVHLIQPDGADKPFTVFCNDSIDGGGWTVIQRRLDGAVDFYRTWAEYKEGFGFLVGEFWLGNDKISLLTNQGNYELRIDMNSRTGASYFAKYDRFRISDEWSKYRLASLGRFLPESTVGEYRGQDSMDNHRNMSFTTYDRDNDIHSSYNCAAYHHSAWWYFNCDNVDLNSIYFGSSDHDSIEWNNLPGGSNYGLTFTEMKIRPL